MQNDQKPIVGAIVLAGAMIAGAILLRGSGAPQVSLPSFEGRPISADEHIVGDPDAKIIIVEYSDLECPFCKMFHETMHQVVRESNGTVAWVYRHFPIPELHKKAFHEAEATECAAELGGNAGFWKYTDRVFEVTGSNDSLDPTELPKIAEHVGLDVALFTECLGSGKFQAKIEADIADGLKAGLNQPGTGTPYSVILRKGKVVETLNGALPYEAVMQKLKAIR